MKAVVPRAERSICLRKSIPHKVKSALSSLIFACLFPSSLLVYLRHIPGKWLIRGWWMVCWKMRDDFAKIV